MTALERIQEWVVTFPGFDILSTFQVDYTDQIPNTGGIFPSGLVEVERREDILGGMELCNQPLKKRALIGEALHCYAILIYK